MRERHSERRSAAVANASQTRPDQTRVFVTHFRGVSGYSFHPSHGDLARARSAESAHADRRSTRPLRRMDGASGAGFGGGR